MVKLMTVRQPRHSEEKFAHRDNEIYESQVRAALQMPQGSPLAADKYGKGVAALETEALEMVDKTVSYPISS